MQYSQKRYSNSNGPQVAAHLQFENRRLKCVSLALAESFVATLTGEVCEEELEELFEALTKFCEKETFDLPSLIDPHTVTEFSQSVYRELCQVSMGETVTYKELGDRIGTRSPRAVGRALNRNPWPLFIPCHRVVMQSGLGGFHEGVEVKRALLSWESEAQA